MKHTFFLLAVTAIVVACGNKTTGQKTMSKKEFQEQCRQTIEACDKLENAVHDLDSNLSYDNICKVQRLSDKLSFDYDPALLDSAQLAKAKEVDQLIEAAKRTISQQLDQKIKQGNWYLINLPEILLEGITEYPIYLERGEKLLVNIITEKPADVRIYNVQSHQLLRTYSGKTIIKDSLSINFSSVYLVEINPHLRQYAGVELMYHPNSLERLRSPKQVTTEQVEGQKGDFRVKTVKGIKMTNLFEEPRKFTLRSQLKATFSNTSNSDRAIVAIQIPTGATDVLYSLRISTNEGDKSTDGGFSENLGKSYKKIKMLGLPIYEKETTSGSSIIGWILGENKPPREEEAYINMYVFYNSAQAKKFQDGGDVTKLQYSIDYSRMGAQSCNGRIPSKGQKTIYLGFQNERVRFNNYVWLEAVSAVPNTEYFKTEYLIK